MARQTVDSIKPQTAVHEVFRVLDKQLRTNRQGSLYLLLQLTDRTGTISAMRWNASQHHAEGFSRGDYVRVQATSQLHNGILQLIVQEMEVVDASRVDPSEFDAMDHQQVAKDWERMMAILGTVERPLLRALAMAFCEDPVLERGLKMAPAGVKAHHAHPGGLLSHVVSLLANADKLSASYPQVDRDLLLVGTLLHDIGKLEELSYDGEIGYTVPGQLVGHLVQGVQMLDWKAIEVAEKTGEAIDRELLWRLQHMIVSHHGTLEHGSPKVPMTLEAILLHYLDDMDAKLNAASELIKSDMSGDPHWTSFNPTLGRKIYKPSYRAEPLT